METVVQLMRLDGAFVYWSWPRVIDHGELANSCLGHYSIVDKRKRKDQILR